MMNEIVEHHTMPIVSIIVPCYNAEKYILETLQSIQSSVYPSWECIIINDGSTDNSLNVIKEAIDGNSRFTILSQENAGPSVARNNGIRASHGTYILPLDADDLISKEYISQAVQQLEHDAKIKVVYSNAEYFGKKKGPWILPEYSFNDLLFENMIFCSALFRRSDYDRTRGYDPALHGREDWDFWLELLKTGGDVHKLNGIHFFYRTHEESRDRKANRNLEHIRQHIFNNHRELYAYCFENPIQIYHEHAFFKEKYNILRRLTLRKPIS